MVERLKQLYCHVDSFYPNYDGVKEPHHMILVVVNLPEYVEFPIKCSHEIVRFEFNPYRAMAVS